MIGMGAVSVTNIKNGKDGTPGIGIANSYVQYCYGGSATDPPGEYLTDENGIYLVDETGKYLTNGEWQADVPAAQPGLYLWSRTVTTFDDGNKSYMYSIGREGLGILNEKKQFYLSSSLTELKDGYWSDVEPYPIPEGKYLFGRYEFIMTDGSIQYSDAHYENVLSGVINKTDALEKSITMKVWETDIDAKISNFDSEYRIRDRITSQELNIDGIWTSITDQDTETITKPDGTVVTTMASRVHVVEETAARYGRLIEGSDSLLGQTSTLAEQTADHISWIIETNDKTATTFTLKPRLATLTADYINLNGLVTFNGLDSTAQNKITKPETLLKTWTGDANLATTTINGGYIRSHTIVADHLATNAIMSFGKQNQQTGQYTGGYSRDANSKFSSTGSFFDMENGNIFTPSFSIINTIPAGENLTTGGFFSGNVVAQTGNIGGWTIDGNLLYSVAKTPGSTSMILTPTGVTSTTSIGGSTGSKTWALTIKDKFGVTVDGYMYATNADISGQITSTSGSIGGINVNNIGIYTGTKSAANSTQEGFLISNTGAIYLGAYNSTRNSTAFQVNPNGYVKAYNLDALGGSVGGWKITDSMLYYNSNSSATSPTTPSTSAIILSPLGNSQTVNVGGSGTNRKNWGITAGTGFGVTTTGELWCNNANVSGTINATAGVIGGCRIVNGVLDVGSATIGEISGDQITVGTISADRINISNLGELSENLGTITSGQIGDSINGITIGSDSTSAWIYYDKVSLVGDIGSNGFYIGTDGIAFGKNNTFKMTKDGVGNIGPWYIDGTSISKKGTNTTSVINPSTFKEQGSGNMYFGNNGLSISDVFYVDSSGSLTAENATITGTIYADTYKLYNYIDIGGRQMKVSTDVIAAQSLGSFGSAIIKIGEDALSYPATIQLLYSGDETIINEKTGETEQTGTIRLSAPTKIQLVSSDVKINTISIGTESSGSRLKVNSDLRASTIYSSGTYRAFYNGDNTVPCIQTLPTPSGITSGSYLPLYSVLFGSNSSYNCMAVPINGDDIFFRIATQSNGTTYKWYSLRDDILAGSGGGNYTAGNGINISSGTISIAPSEVASSLSSYFAASSHTHSQYLTSIPSNLTCNKLTADTTIYISADITNPGGDYACLVNQNNGTYKLARREGSSSKRYKDHKGYVSIEQAQKILDIPVINFVYKEGYLSKNSPLQGVQLYGFYAEDVEKCAHQAVYYNSDGLVENWKERDMIPLMLRVIQDQQKRIEELEKKLAQ